MKRLYRATDHKLLAGVCAGLGDYFDIDPVIFRIIFIALSLPGGLPGVLPYIVLWLIIPAKPAGPTDILK